MAETIFVLQKKYNVVCTCYPVKAKREEKEQLLNLERKNAIRLQVATFNLECGLGLSQKFQMGGCRNWEGILNPLFSH